MAEKIVTKLGDKGKTSLYYGRRLDKDDIRIEAIGVLDELSCWLGFTKAQLNTKKDKSQLEAIQKDLLVLSAEVASENKFLDKLKRRIDENSISVIEEKIKESEKKAKKINSFILAGENKLSSYLDLSRAIARKAERRIVSLVKKKSLNNKCILIYLNRLSDLLYIWARSKEK